ncbi:uncharacterized protein ARMOST_17386 [Armillaria ostoyae]|uniref:Uncharacterized protein n=1 Tax=Armillaria ostoyae TaxID=47428 RepID=A0A284RYV0_ARMOS|nr:uncharacterized protein ARMOST_17386 [Armillaria ostoyae]
MSNSAPDNDMVDIRLDSDFLSFTSMDTSSITIGPPALRLNLRLKADALTSNIDLLSDYAELLVRAMSENKDYRSQPVRDLQYALLNLLDLVANNWTCANGASMLNVVDEPPEDRESGLSKIRQILFDSNNEVPELNKSQWCQSILEIARTLGAEDILCLKNRCSSSVWAALVFCNIRHTAARTLEDMRVCKVRISDWDLFPTPMMPSCLNCVKKKHPSCPKAATRKVDSPSPPHIVSGLKRSSPDSDSSDTIPVKRLRRFTPEGRAVPSDLPCIHNREYLDFYDECLHAMLAVIHRRLSQTANASLA